MEWFAPEQAAHYQEAQAHEGHTHEAGDIAYWTCPMHPSVQAAEAGPCPICFMDLQPVPHTEALSIESEAPTSQPTAGIPGFITLTPWQQQLIGVTTAPVERQSMHTTIRTVGRIDYDETRLADVNLKVNGWIEQLYVDYTGQTVVEGEPLFTLYSPALVSTQEEYLLTFQTVQNLETGDHPPEEIGQEALVRLRSLLQATRRRLLLWDLSEEQIQSLEVQGESPRVVTIPAPASGIVSDKMAVEGMYVTPAMRLYRIAGVDTVWVYVEVYEYELPLVHPGQQATITLAHQPDQTIQGTVDYIYPYLDPKTRTAKVRLQVPNPGRHLRPDMYVDVVLAGDAQQRLMVAENAVLVSGKQRLVFVDMGNGQFQPRTVKLGGRMEDHYHLLEGLIEGERVVTSANFLLDSESKLKNVVAGMATQLRIGAGP